MKHPQRWFEVVDNMLFADDLQRFLDGETAQVTARGDRLFILVTFAEGLSSEDVEWAVTRLVDAASIHRTELRAVASPSAACLI